MRNTIVTIAAVGLLLAGCSNSTQPPEAVPATAPSVSLAAPPAPAGPTPVKVGEQFDVISTEGVPQAKVTLQTIEADPTCTTNFGDPRPAKGSYVAIELDVQTKATLDSQQFSYPTAYDFNEVKPDGYTNTDVYPQSDLCTADRDGFDPMAPSSKYRGWVLIDVVDTTSLLTFQPHFSTGATSPSWQVAIPAPSGSAATTTTEATTAPTSTPARQCGPGGGCVTLTAPENSPLPPQGPEDESDRGAGGVDTAPGCGGRAVGASVFNPACTEYQGHLDPGTRGGRAPSSGELQTQYGCEQGYITGAQCDGFR